jgi:uncharacterized protein YraI
VYWSNGKDSNAYGAGLPVRLCFAFLTASLFAGLSACSAPGIVTAPVKLQQAPAVESEVLATIPRGSTVKVKDCTNGWCRVSWNGRDGYTLTKNLRIGGFERRTTDTDKPDDDDIEDKGNVSVPDSSDAAAPN